jgi:hypothetical protein
LPQTIAERCETERSSDQVKRAEDAMTGGEPPTENTGGPETEPLETPGGQSSPAWKRFLRGFLRGLVGLAGG